MGDVEQGSSLESSLAYRSLNEHAERTILLIHGAFGDGYFWDMVTPMLADYHLLIPDLPGHAESRKSLPFSVARAALLLKQLIAGKAHNGIAHVVGHSLGARVAISLASTFPDVVSHILISGFGILPTTRLSPYVPYAVWTMQRIENLIPRSLIRWAMDGTDLPCTDTSFCTVSLCQQIFGSTPDAEGWPSPWPHPTLIIVAGKADMLPTSDNPQHARRLASIGQQMNCNTRAVSHPQMRHPWLRQAPLLFAATIRDWFEDGRVPDGFISL